MELNPRPPSLPSERATPLGERGGGRRRITPTQRQALAAQPAAAGIMTSTALGSSPFGSL